MDHNLNTKYRLAVVSAATRWHLFHLEELRTAQLCTDARMTITEYTVTWFFCSCLCSERECSLSTSLYAQTAH